MKETFENFRRRVALVLAIVMIISCLPMNALAAITTDVFGGAQLFSIAVEQEGTAANYATYVFTSLADSDPTKTQVIKVVGEDKGTLAFPASPTKDGEKFIGWYDAATGGTQINAAREEDGGKRIDLYPQFEPVYYVFFMDNLNRVYTTKEGVSGQTISADVKFPVNANQSITGWYTDTNFENEWDFATDIVQSDLTLHAGYDQIFAYGTGLAKGEGTVTVLKGDKVLGTIKVTVS